jgi:hypothetical protein
VPRAHTALRVVGGGGRGMMQRRAYSSQGTPLGSAVSEAMAKEPAAAAAEEAAAGPESLGWRAAKLVGGAVAFTSTFAIAGLVSAQFGACRHPPRPTPELRGWVSESTARSDPGGPRALAGSLWNVRRSYGPAGHYYLRRTLAPSPTLAPATS